MKKMWKRALAALLGMGMVFSLAACGNGDSASSTAPSQNPGASAAPSTGGNPSSGKTIVGIYKMGTATWFIQEGAASQKVVEDAGYTWKFMDCDQNAATYMDLLNTVSARPESESDHCGYADRGGNPRHRGGRRIGR